MTFAAVVVLGYLLGSCPWGYWLVRLIRHEDIRTVGSGNIGATNVWRTYGRWLGVPVVLLDMVKGFAPALLGMLFAFAGAAIETTFSGAYNVAQFFGWSWGKFRRPREAGRFHVAWFVLLALSAIVIVTGIDPVAMVEYSIVFAVVTLPFTFFPVLVIAGDKRLMGPHASGRIANWLGWLFLVLTTLAALAAIPLLILTHGGKG